MSDNAPDEQLTGNYSEPAATSTLPTDEVVIATTATQVPKAVINYWRILSLVLIIQGLYYAFCGLWPLLRRLVALPALPSAMSMTSYADTQLQTLSLLIGLVLIISAIRQRPSVTAVLLGLGAAVAYFATEMFYRSYLPGLVYADMVLEVLFFLALGLVYLTALIATRRRGRAVAVVEN